jgi:hypothetical protein
MSSLAAAPDRPETSDSRTRPVTSSRPPNGRAREKRPAESIRATCNQSDDIEFCCIGLRRMPLMYAPAGLAAVK